MADNRKKAEKDPSEVAGSRTEGSTDEAPEVRVAADAVCRAEEEFKKAIAAYKHLRQEATSRADKLRETTAGEMIDGTFTFVRKHPGMGLAAAALLGFFLGRLFRR